jgi:hypothetical protein
MSTEYSENLSKPSVEHPRSLNCANSGSIFEWPLLRIQINEYELEDMTIDWVWLSLECVIDRESLDEEGGISQTEVCSYRIAPYGLNRNGRPVAINLECKLKFA